MTIRTASFTLSRQGTASLLGLLAACVAAGAGSTARVDIGVRLLAVTLVAAMVTAAAGQPTRGGKAAPAA